MRLFSLFWDRISSDQWIRDAVRGYKIEFKRDPIQYKLPNNMPFSRDEKECISVEVGKLLGKGAIRRASFHPNQFLSNLFTIPKKGGELRPVINLKPLNHFVEYHHFKMEGLTSLLEFSKINALKENLNDFDAACSLSQGAKDELEWFSTRCHLYNGTSIKKRSSVMVLTTDASQSGWGVTLENQSTNGEWSMEEKKQHINWLELETVLLGLQSFLSSSCGGNVIKQHGGGGGGIVSLNCIAYSIWELCLSFDCSIEAFHVPGVENVCADRLSREHESSLAWKLHPTVFKWIAERYFAPDIDLFASRLNYQVGRYVSWKPDPGAWAVDAFSVVWSCLKPYLFPPFSLLGKVLQKLKVEEVPSAVVIIPDWPTTHWFPLILEMVINRPLLLPQWHTLLILPQSGQLHPLRKSLRLAAWNLSGVDWKGKEFFQGQPHTSCSRGEPAQGSSTRRRGRALLAGVSKGREILYKRL